MSLEKKHLNPTIYFPSSLPNQKHSKKVFIPIFFPKFSIHPISPPNKHTLNDYSIQTNAKLKNKNKIAILS